MANNQSQTSRHQTAFLGNVMGIGETSEANSTPIGTSTDTPNVSQQAQGIEDSNNVVNIIDPLLAESDAMAEQTCSPADEAVGYAPVDAKSALSRKVFVNHFHVETLSPGEITTLSVPGGLRTSTFPGSTMFEIYKYLSTRSIKFYLQTSATPTAIGSLYLRWYPGKTRKGSTVINIANTFETTSKLLDLGEGNSIEFEVPAISPFQVLDTTKTMATPNPPYRFPEDGYNSWGELEIGVFNTISGGEEATGNFLDVNLFIELIDPELKVMIPRQPATEFAFLAPLLEAVAPALIGGVVNAVSKVGEKCTEYILSSGDGFVLNNETTNDKRSVVTTAYSVDDLEITRPPTMPVESDKTLQSLMAAKSIKHRVTFTTAQTEGELIATHNVGVDYRDMTEETGEHKTFTPTNLTGIAQFFRFWKGDITFTYQVIGNAYTRGTLLFAYHPTEEKKLSYADAYACPNVLLNLAEKRSVSITIPYNGTKPWKQFAEKMGRMTIFCASALRFMPGSSGASQLDINIYEHSDNMMMRDPMDMTVASIVPPEVTPIVETEIGGAVGTSVNIFGDNSRSVTTTTMLNPHEDIQQIMTKREPIVNANLKAGFHKFFIPIPSLHWITEAYLGFRYDMVKASLQEYIFNSFAWFSGSFIISTIFDNAADERIGMVVKRIPYNETDDFRFKHISYETIDQEKYNQIVLGQNSLIFNRSVLPCTDIHVPMYLDKAFLPAPLNVINDFSEKTQQWAHAQIGVLEIYVHNKVDTSITITQSAGPGFQLSQFIGAPNVYYPNDRITNGIDTVIDTINDIIHQIIDSLPTDVKVERPLPVPEDNAKRTKDIIRKFQSMGKGQTEIGRVIRVCLECEQIGCEEHEKSVSYMQFKNKGTYACPVCDIISKDQPGLFTHLKNSHPKYVHWDTCEGCGNNITSPDEHQKECYYHKPQRCEYCNIRVKNFPRLQTHIRKSHDAEHPKERPRVEVFQEISDACNAFVSNTKNIPNLVDQVTTTSGTINESMAHLTQSVGTSTEAMSGIASSMFGINNSFSNMEKKASKLFDKVSDFIPDVKAKKNSNKRLMRFLPAEIRSMINGVKLSETIEDILYVVVATLLDKIPELPCIKQFGIHTAFIAGGVRALATFLPMPDKLMNVLNVWLASHTLNGVQDLIFDRVMPQTEAGPNEVKAFLAVIFMLFTMVAGIFNPHNLWSHIKDCFKLLNFARCAASVFILVEGIQTIWEYVSKKLGGEVDPESMDYFTKNRGNIEVFIGMAIDDLATPTSKLLMSVTERRRVVRQKEFCIELMGEITKLNMQSKQTDTYYKICTQYLTLIKQCMVAPNTQQRARPVPLTLYGNSQVGKTFLSSSFIPKALSHILQWGDDSVFEKPASADEHWTGYAGQPIVTLNDAGSRVDCKDLMMYLNMIGNEPLSVSMAHLEDKGTKFFSQVVIATTNKFKPKVSHVYTNPEAFYNRWFENFIEITVKPEFAKADKSLDKSKINPTMTPDEYLNFYQITEYTNLTTPRGKTQIKFRELMYKIAKQVKEEARAVESERPSFDFSQWDVLEVSTDKKRDEYKQWYKICKKIKNNEPLVIEDLVLLAKIGRESDIQNRILGNEQTRQQAIQLLKDNPEVSIVWHRHDSEEALWVIAIKAARPQQKPLDNSRENPNGETYESDEIPSFYDSIWIFLYTGQEKRKNVRFVTELVLRILIFTVIIATIEGTKFIIKIAKRFIGCEVKDEPKKEEPAKPQSVEDYIKEMSAKPEIYDSGNPTSGTPRSARKVKPTVETYDTEPTSGTKPTVRKAKPVVEDGTQNDIPLMYDIVANNVVRLVSSGFEMYGLGIKGHLMITNYHFMEKFSDGENFQVGYGWDGKMFTTTFYTENLKRLSFDGESTDIVMYDLKWTGPQFRDITKHFIDAKDILRITGQTGYRLTPKVITTLPSLDFIHKIEVENVGSDDVIFPISVVSKGKKSRGSCGSPWIVENDKFFTNTGKICGIHSWGMDSLIGSSLLTKEDVIALTDKFITITQDETELPVTEIGCRYDLYTDQCYIASNAGVFLPTKTELKPTPWAGEIYPVESQPSVLSAKDKRLNDETKPIFKTNCIGKTDQPTGWFSKPELFEQSVEAVAIELGTYTQVEARTLTYDEVTNGLSDSGWERDLSLQMKNSAGYPWNKKGSGKFPWFDEYHENGLKKWKPQPELLKACERRLEMAKDHKIPNDSIWIDIIKDELRPNAKIPTGKSRIVNGPPLDLIMVFGKYFGAFKALIMHPENRGFKSESALGIDPIDFWPELGLKLKSSVNAFGVDYSAYDASVPAELHRGVVRSINAWYLANAKDKEQAKLDNEIRELLYYEVPHTRHLFGNFMYNDDHGLPSGAPAGMTTITNIMVNKLISRTALAYTGIHPLMFQRCVGALFMGDDNLQWIKPNCPEKYKDKVALYNRKLLGKVASELGMVVTMPDKSLDLTEFDSFEELSFLKRTFCDAVRTNCFLPAIETRTIYNLVNWNRPASNPDQHLENLREALIFAVPYGRDFFDKFRNELLGNVKIRTNLDAKGTKLPHFEYLLMEYYLAN